MRLLHALPLVLFAATAPSSAAAHTWFPSAPGPTALSQASASADGTTIYVVGGEVSDGGTGRVPTDAALAYDVCSEVYTPLPAMPVAAKGADSAILNGILYVAGGDGLGNSLVAYDPVANSWSTLTSAPNSGSGWEVTLVADPTTLSLHLIGGEGSATQHQVYDVASGLWSTATPPPVGVTGADAFWEPDSDTLVMVMGYRVPSHTLVRTTRWAPPFYRVAVYYVWQKIVSHSQSQPPSAFGAGGGFGACSCSCTCTCA